MRLGVLAALIGATVLAGTACETITEVGDQKKPLQNDLTIAGPGVITGLPTPNPGPTPTPGPQPTPGATPTPGPSPTPEPAPPNAKPVVRLALKVLFVVCNNQGLPDSEGMTYVPVGCKVHFDLTPKDENNKPTDTVGTPRWSFDNPDIIELFPDPFTPYVLAKQWGLLRVWVNVDGVTSNELLLQFYR